MIPAAAIVLLFTIDPIAFVPADVPAPASAAREYHVRGVDSRVRDWIRIGASGSLTFSTLLDRLATSDVIVYVEIVPRISTGVSGHLLFVTSTRTVRYLRVALADDGGRTEMVSRLGHELQHAVEIADAPCVRDSEAVARFYQAIGGTDMGGSRYDSAAARAAGERVREELTASVKSMRDRHSSQIRPEPGGFECMRFVGIEMRSQWLAVGCVRNECDERSN